MRTVSAEFRAEMVKQTVNAIARRFKYNGIDRSDYPQSWGSAALDAKQITAGSVALGLINTDKLWNMFLSDAANLRKVATIEVGLLGVPISPAFADSLRSADSPSNSPSGIGGDANTIWHCDDEALKVYELSTTDFSEIRSASGPTAGPSGIGGDANTIWHCSWADGKVYELSTTDFSTVRSASAPAWPSEIGGDANTIWTCSIGAQKVYELSTTDFSEVRNAASPSTHPDGIGGDASVIWHNDWDSKDVYELSITDFSTVRSDDSPDVLPSGIGGDANTIWHCGYYFSKAHELSVVLAGTTSEYMTIFTGLGDETAFEGAFLTLQLRNKMVKMLEKMVGSEESPVNYYS